MVTRWEGLLLLRDRRCLSLLRHHRCILNTATLRRRALPDAREARCVLVANHVELLCIYCSGGVCQQDGGGGLYVARPRKPNRRRRVCGTREEGEYATRADEIGGNTHDC